MTKKEITEMSVRSPAEVMMSALDKGADLDKIEKFMQLQERWEANEAKKAYNKDMVLVHNEIEPIAKTLKNPQTGSKYAPLDEIINKTKPIYTKHGFSLTFYETDSNTPDYMRLNVKITHKLGHSEVYHYDNPIVNTGIKGNVNMTLTHAKASSVSYAKRYLLCMVLNIPTGNDNDGNVIKEKIDESKIKLLSDLIVSLKVNEKEFLKYMGVDSISNINKSDFAKAKLCLEAKRKAIK